MWSESHTLGGESSALVPSTQSTFRHGCSFTSFIPLHRCHLLNETFPNPLIGKSNPQTPLSSPCSVLPGTCHHQVTYIFLSISSHPYKPDESRDLCLVLITPGPRTMPVQRMAWKLSRESVSRGRCINCVMKGQITQGQRKRSNTILEDDLNRAISNE